MKNLEDKIKKINESNFSKEKKEMLISKIKEKDNKQIVEK